MVDQVLSSGTQLLLLVLVARQADPATFGALSVALIANGFLLGLVRAGIGEVVLLRCRAERSASQRDARVGLFLALAAGGVAGLGLLGASTIVSGEAGRFLSLMALAAPLVYTQDLLRYVAYGLGQVDQAIVLDGVWLGVQAVVSGTLLAWGEATPIRLVLAWVGGAGAGALVGVLRQRLRLRPVAISRWWVEERARAGGFLTDFLVSNGMWQSSFLLLGAMFPLDEFGALRVAFLSLSPLANLLAGVRTLTLAHLGGLRAEPARARRRAGQLAVALSSAAAVYGTALVLLPDRWGSELFGETWGEAASLVGILAAGEVLRLSTFAAIDLIKVLGSPIDLVRTRLVGGVTVVVGLLVGAAAAGPRGAVVGTVTGYALHGIIWWREAWTVGQRPAQPAPTVPA
jgi:O-antigen/teichoic acid export membrane protein